MILSKLKKKAVFTLFVVCCFLIGIKDYDLAAETKKSFVWEINYPQGRSYILGSVHYLKKSDYPLSKSIEQAYAESEALMVEADVSEKKVFEISALVLKRGMYQGEETLEKSISKKTYALVKKRLQARNMNIESFNKFKPWFLAMTIISLEFVKLGYDPNFGVDKYFMDKAAGKKEILELEGIEFQLNLFEQLSAEDQEKFLFNSLEEADMYNKELDDMVAAWKNGQAEALEKFVNLNREKYYDLKELFNKILDDRNEQMVEKLVTYLKTGKKYLIIVGAAHLVGQKGIINILMNRGYKLKQL